MDIMKQINQAQKDYKFFSNMLKKLKKLKTKLKVTNML